MKVGKIPFNRPYINGNVQHYLQMAFDSGHISGNGKLTSLCQSWLSGYYSAKALLTGSGTAALEMAAILTRFEPGDEVIIPSFTFVSTANAFLLHGAVVRFADVGEDYPNLDIQNLESLISKKTKAVVPVHYAGVACDMDQLANLADKYKFTIIEDAAHSVASYYKMKPLGSIGRFGALSFHETKNITAGEGGAILLNAKSDYERAEVVWEKGTNRAAFHRGEIRKYEWIDLGSSFLPSELNAALLYSQIELLDEIQHKRTGLWNSYFQGLEVLEEEGKIRLPKIPPYATVNGHLFFIQCESKAARDDLVSFLNSKGIHAVFHYLPLHQSPFFRGKHDGTELKNSVRFSETLIRLPLFAGLKEEEQNFIIDTIISFF